MTEWLAASATSWQWITTFYHDMTRNAVTNV